jgi:hypothetical protein
VKTNEEDWIVVERIYNDKDTKKKYLENYKIKNRVDLVMLKTDVYGCKFGECEFELMFVEVNHREIEVKTRKKHTHDQAAKGKNLAHYIKLLMTKHLEKGKNNQTLLQDLRAEVSTENLPNPRQITQKRYYQNEKKRAQLCELENSRKSERACAYERKSVPATAK